MQFPTPPNVVSLLLTLLCNTLSLLGPTVLSVTSRDLSLATTLPGESKNFDQTRRGKGLEYSSKGTTVGVEVAKG